MTPVAIIRQRVITWIRERAERLIPALGGMTKRDAARWAAVRDMAGLGEMVTAWLNGEVAQTPGHCGPPCAETIPLIPVLTRVNRAGFVTDCSQLAETHEGRTWNTWVDGFATDATLTMLREAVAGTPLILGACRGRSHEHEHVEHLCRCCWKELVDFWSEGCPAIADELANCWLVSIEDPEPGRNDRLWPALAAFASARAS